MLRRTLLTSLLFGLLALGANASANPSEIAVASAVDGAPAVVEVTVIHATSKGTVDTRLGELERTLLHAFKGYLGFAQLSSDTVKLGAEQSHHMALPNGTELEFKYLGTEDGFLRLHLEVGGLKSTVRVKSGSTFFQAGRGFKDGMIVLAFRASTDG